MDDKLREYWNSNKLMFFLVVIPLGLLFVAFTLRDVIFSMLAGQVRKDTAEASKKDADIQAQSAAAAAGAAQAAQTAADAQKRIDDRKEGDVQDDWYKKQS